MKSYRLLGNVVATLVFGLFSMSSHAVLITNSTPYDFSWSYSSGAAGLLTGNGSLTVGGFGTSSLTVAVSLSNTSTPASDRLTAFGFGINPNAASVTFADAADGGMINASMSFIPSLATIEVCAYGGRNCMGGSNGGILGNGGTDSFSLVLRALAGTTWGTSVDIDPIGFKYQTGYGSYEFTTSVPEPATLSLLGAGLLLIGFSRKRKQNA